MAFNGVPIAQSGYWEDRRLGSSLGSDLMRLVGGGLGNLGAIKRHEAEQALEREDRLSREHRLDSQFQQQLAQSDRHFNLTRSDKSAEDGVGYVQNPDGTWDVDPDSLPKTTVPQMRSAGAALQAVRASTQASDFPEYSTWEAAKEAAGTCPKCSGRAREMYEEEKAAATSSRRAPTAPASSTSSYEYVEPLHPYGGGRESTVGAQRVLTDLGRRRYTQTEAKTISGLNNTEADNRRLATAAGDKAAAAAEKARMRAAGMHLFKTIHPELTDEQAAALADQDPLVVNRLFDSLDQSKNRAEDNARQAAAAKAKADQDKTDEAAYGALVASRREKRELTPEEAATVGRSKWGATAFEKRGEGEANRSLREELASKSAAAARQRHLESLQGALRTATLGEVKAHLANAKADLSDIYERKRNDFPDEATLLKDPEYVAAKRAVDLAQAEVENRAKEGKDSIQETMRELLRGSTGSDTAGSSAPVADFATVDAEVRKEMSGKPEAEIRAEVVRRMRSASAAPR